MDAACAKDPECVYVEGTKAAAASLGRVLILGLGVSGKAAARYCASLVGGRVQALFVAAGARTSDSERFCTDELPAGTAVAYGDDGVSQLIAGMDDASEAPFDLCIASPGIPFWHELYEQALAASAELVSEVDFAWRESARDSRWVAITGTNGKTTTTALCAALLQAGGLSANAVGNIGDTCIEAVSAGETDVYVAELSSYQLASCKRFVPDAAVILNITPDHLHWHKSFEAYRQAKLDVLDMLARGDDGLAVLDATDDEVRACVRSLRAQSEEQRGFAYIPLGTKAGIGGDMRAACGADNAAFLDGQGVMRIAYRGVVHAVGAATDAELKGEHNVHNMLAAASVAVGFGIDDDRIEDTMLAFPALEHRIEPCGSVAGIECFNDSKATNTDAVLKALAAFQGQRLVVLLGGQDKGTDLAELVTAVHEASFAAVCYGEAGPRFMRAFEEARGKAPEGFQVFAAQHMEEALERALQIARPGDVVLLSPACASFDEFKSFEHRGRVFKDLVAAHAARQGA